MLKFIAKTFFAAIIILAVFVTYLGFKIKKEEGNLGFASAIHYFWSKLDPSKKKEIKDDARDIKDEIYDEATTHNPEGDVLPDNVDDDLKAKLKREFRE